MPRFVFAAVLAVLLMPWHAHGASELDSPPPLVQVGRLAASSPASDIWKQPAAIPRLEYYVFDYLPSQQTEVRLACDDANLYVALRCLESQPEKIRTEQTARDSDLTSDDCVSVYLDPDNDPKTYYHLLANAAGVQYDEKDAMGFPASWDAKWQVETSRGEKEWRALFTIPFASLGVSAPRGGEVWRANFGRRSKPSNERSIWATVRGHLVEPERWGSIVFAGEQALTATCSLTDINSQREFAPVSTRGAGTCGEPSSAVRAPGPVSLDLRISNPRGAAADLTASVFCDGRLLDRTRIMASPGQSSHRLAFDYDLEGLRFLSVQVTEGRGKGAVMRTPAVAAYIKPHRETLAKFERMARQAKPRSAEASHERAAVLAAISDLRERAAAAFGSESRWKALGAGIEEVEKSLGRLRARCADTGGKGYAVGVETSVRKILRDRLFEGEFGRPARIDASRNEFEGVQIGIVAHGTDLSGVNVSVSELAGPSGAVIPASDVTLNLVDFVKTGWPRYATEYAGWWPDPLMPNAPFDLARGGIRPVWVNVRARTGIPAGLYRGAVTVRPENAPETVVPLEVRVWDFDLPVTGRFKTAFALFEHELALWYGEVNEEMLRDWYAFLLEHRINPTNIYSQTARPERRDMEFCVERGMNSFTLACTWYKGETDRAGIELADRLREERDYLKARGWMSMPYIYGFDEVDFRKYEELKETYGWLGRKFPDIPRMCTVRPVDALAGYIDIWVPLTSHWVEEDVRAARERGDEVWNYVCCHPLHPWPNYFVDYPAIDQRIIPWMNWKFGVPGLLYYAINLWETNRDAGAGRHDDPAAAKAIAEGKRWPDVPWNTFTCADFNGDGHLVYPGKDGKPLSSVRLENIRDGIEDYECLAVLSELIAEAEKTGVRSDALARGKRVVKVRESVVQSFRDYTLDPDVLLAARTELLRVTQDLSQALKRGRR